MKNNAIFNAALVVSLVSITNCATNVQSGLERKLLKYPVVLVHGIAANDRTSFFDFWGRIPVVLRKEGVQVFFGNTDAWGSYESNAIILKNTIEKILEETQAEKVNIIAHSKGGIDSRYLIWRHGFGDRVASLTTVSTPHHGAELADLISGQDIIYSKPASQALEVFGKLYGDIHPDLYAVLRQLTTGNMRVFNQTVMEDERVHYQSLYTVMNSPIDDLLFSPTFLYIQKISGPNDGVVSEKSATWGINPRKIVNKGISHRQNIDIQKRKVSGVNVPLIYVDIIHELASKGF